MHTFVSLRLFIIFLVFVWLLDACDRYAVFCAATCLGVLDEAITTERHAVATRHILLAPLHEREAKPVAAAVVIVIARVGCFDSLLFEVLELASPPIEQCTANCL